MKNEDIMAIAEHAAAKVSSDEFRPSVVAAYAVIREIREYQDMAAIILHKRGVKIAAPDEEFILSAADLADVVLIALSCGFAFGEDYGLNKFTEGLVIAK